jgi:hypothetical protein
MGLSIAAETSLQDKVRVLIAELYATPLELTPPEFCFHMSVCSTQGARRLRSAMADLTSILVPQSWPGHAQKPQRHLAFGPL